MRQSSIVELLRYLGAGNCDGAANRAAELRAQGMTLREVGVRLTLEGHKSAGGGAWYASRVHALLASQGAVEDSCGENDLSESLQAGEVGRPGAAAVVAFTTLDR